MADVQPLNALHYALDRVGGLPPVVAPPYDVIDTELRADLAARSPYNVVEIDLPQADGDLDPYAHAASLFSQLAGRRGPRPRPRARAVGARPGLHRPRRQPLHAQGLLRARAGRGLRPRPHPPPRAHAPGPEGGPPSPHARHPGQPLPHLQPLRRPRRGGVERALPAHRDRPVGRGDRRRRHPAPALAGRRRRGAQHRHRRPRRHRAADRRRASPLRDRPRLRRRGRRRGRAPLRAHVPRRPPGPGPHRLPHPPPADRAARRQAPGAARGDPARLGDDRDRGGRAPADRRRRRPHQPRLPRRPPSPPAAAHAQGRRDRRPRPSRTCPSPTAASTPRCSRR